jgi:glycosyltransferase involved in cell wall biosynthesis
VLRQTSGVEPLLCIPADLDQSNLAYWQDLGCELVTFRSLKRWTPAWLFRQAANVVRDARWDHEIEGHLARHRIDVTFLRPTYGRSSRVPAISWIPDFQHLHLPGLFNRAETTRRTRLFRAMAAYSDAVMLSSQAAYRDYAAFEPSRAAKGRVCPFVVPLPPAVYAADPRPVIGRYQLPEKFVFFPGQFWKHKNHLLVIEALTLAKQGGQEPVVVCSGNPQDYRWATHWRTLIQARSAHRIEQQLRFLGLIPYEDVLALIRQSVAVLNPSLFEGWSTTVEEAKAFGKPLLLSRIAVHEEQDPPSVWFFDPQRAEDLADKLIQLWSSHDPGPDHACESAAHEALEARVCRFGQAFKQIAEDTIAGRTQSDPAPSH